MLVKEKKEPEYVAAVLVQKQVLNLGACIAKALTSDAVSSHALQQLAMVKRIHFTILDITELCYTCIDKIVQISICAFYAAILLCNYKEMGCASMEAMDENCTTRNSKASFGAFTASICTTSTSNSAIFGTKQVASTCYSASHSEF